MGSIRRVVTGHDARRRAIIVSDGPPPKTNFNEGFQILQYEIWNTDSSPVPIHASETSEPTDRPFAVAPRPQGTVIRVAEFLPSQIGRGKKVDPALAARSFAELGDPSSSTWQPGDPHPMMHRTESIDYGIVTEGEIYMILDDSETRLTAGDIVVQRGTNHAWENRSAGVCRMVFVLIDGEFDPALSAAFPGRRGG